MVLEQYYSVWYKNIQRRICSKDHCYRQAVSTLLRCILKSKHTKKRCFTNKNVCAYMYMYCVFTVYCRRNMPYLQRTFLKLSHVDITKDTFCAATGRQLWSSWRENIFFLRFSFNNMRYPYTSHTHASMIWKVLFNLWMILLILLRVLLNHCSNVIRMVIRYYVHVLTLVQELHISLSLNTYLLLNKCTSALIL